MSGLNYLYKIQPKVNVKINDKDIQGFFYNEEIVDIGLKQNKICFCSKEDIIIGSTLKYNSKSYIILDKDNDYNGVFYVYHLEEMNYTIKFGTSASSMINLMGILSTTNFAISERNIISMATNSFTFTCPKNESTYAIDFTTKIVALRGLYKVTGIDTSNQNLIILTCEKEAKDASFDYTEIWDSRPTEPTEPEEPKPPKNNYTMEITGNKTPYVSSTAPYTLILKNNGEIVTDKPIVWTLSNSSYTFVEQTNTNCKIKTPKEAFVEVILKAKLADDDSVFVEYLIKNRRL